ncbi:unnamed protein product [Lupinus luteus]|uniref:Coenzyme Q-binding protein COQ10 START domain-containing protein n=1 Tax=Lupinus luteus TaxID=3873 RepID=A0AAV1W921_LUPLU
MIKEHEVRFEYEKQSQVRAVLAEELAMLKQVNEFTAKGLSPPRGNNGFARASYMSPNARMARIASLENMLSISSNSLVSMASQLSEAEERERAFTNRGRWNQLRSMGEAKNLLQYMFDSVADARCQLWERDTEIREMKDQIEELVGLLRQSETKRKEVEKELKLREQAVANTLATPASGNSPNSLKHYAEDMDGPLSPMSVPIPKQLKLTPGIANGLVKESVAFIDQSRRMVSIEQLSMKKLAIIGQASGKLWRWKRSHHQWLLQFKWKWQKPWRLSELIRHSDERIMKARPRSPALLHTRALLRSLASEKTGLIQSIKHSKNSGKVNGCRCLTTMASRTIHHHQIHLSDSRIRSSSSLGGFCNINNNNYYNNFVQTRQFLGCGDGEEGVLTRTYEERRVLGYSPEQLFGVVAAVDFYHGFVPWCQRSEILKHYPDGSFDAELEIGFKFLVESYVSHVELERPKRIKTTVSQSNLFDHLINIWEFSPGPVPGTCNLHFLVDFKFQSPLYRQV